MHPFIRSLGGGPSGSFHLYNRIIRAGYPDGAFITFQAVIVADFQSERAVAGRWGTGLNALSASVASFLIHYILVVIVHGIVRIDISDHPPFKGILRAYLSGRDSHLIRHACHIHESGAQHAIAALIEVVDGFYG
jgi:hypothetical protein